jgi:hypothetical protein
LADVPLLALGWAKHAVMLTAGGAGHRGWRRAQFANRNGRPDVTRVTYKFFFSANLLAGVRHKAGA